jgi:hypothetical protein
VELAGAIGEIVQWAIQDMTFSRGARLITGVVPTDFDFDQEVSDLRVKVGLKSEPELHSQER